MNLNTFLTQRGMNLSNYKLGENSIFLGKILKAKKSKKILNNKISYSTVRNSPIKKLLFNSLRNNENESNILGKNKNKKFIYKKSCFLNNHVKSKSNITNDINESKYLFDEENNTLSTNKFFNTNAKLNKKNFSVFMKNINRSSELLNRFNRNKNSSIKKSNEKKIKYLDVLFTPIPHKKPIIIQNNEKLNKIIYSKKRNCEKYKINLTNTNPSRNKKKHFNTQNNSKSKNKINSISHSIDFSIINKINLNENFNNAVLSKTSDNFFILNKKNKSNNNYSQTKSINSNKNNSKNIMFLTHFIKYCYLYFLQIIKKFLNNLKKKKDEKMKNKYSYNKNNNSNLFDEFNNDDFDKETIKNKTSENFYNDLNNNSFSFISEPRKNYIYNRMKRINNQNIQKKNLLEILNTATIENFNNKNIKKNLDTKKNCFDNENEKEKNSNNDNDILHSPFFSRIPTNQDKCSLENRKIILTKNEMKEKSIFYNNNNILGFIKINNEINPFNIQDNNINFFDKDIKNKISLNNIFLQENQSQSTEEILSFRQKPTKESAYIIQIYNSTSLDNKINIDIKYINNNFFTSSTHNNNFKNLQIYNFVFEYIQNKKKLKKIWARLKDAKIVKEKEDIIQRNNNNYFLYNLSTIKEEETPKTKTLKKNENYYPISNNSKLFSKISIEKIIDGEKEINEEDIDKILMDSFSDYNNNYKLKKLKNWQSQEIMVVSNFNSVMRNRRNRKENAKLLIEGILCLIRFFGVLCFNIRKDCYIKLKWNWKMKKFVNYLINFCIKKNV